MLAIAAGAAGVAIGIFSALRINELEDRIDDLRRELAPMTTGEVIVSTGAQSLPGYNAPVSLLTGAGEWAAGPSMPAARSDLQTVLCNGTIYLLGGLNGTYTVVGDVWTYDPVNELYSMGSFTPMPTPRFRFGATCYEDKIYVAGGFADLATGNSGMSLATTDIYDCALDSWSAGPLLNVPRGDLALAAVNGRLLAIGGYDHSYNAMDTTEVLDLAAEPTSASWAVGPPMVHPKGDLQAAVIGDRVYVPGGWNPTNTFLTELAIYDATAGTWSLGAPMSAPRGDKAVVALGGRIFAFGGEMWSGVNSMCDWGWGPEECAVNLIPMHGVEMYSPEDDAWTSMSPLPASRFRFAGVAVEGRASEGAIYVFGGHAHGEVAVSTAWNFHYVPRPNLYFHTRTAAA